MIYLSIIPTYLLKYEAIHKIPNTYK